jgi:hypothetical protein
VHVGSPEAGELALVADAPTANPVRVEHHLVQRLVGDRGGGVELALGFLDDDLQLAGELGLVDQRMAEGVGLDVHRLREARGRQDGEIAGVIVAGAGVEIAARALGLTGDGPDAAARGALEEHVLEHVGDAQPAVGLVEEARLHVGHHRHHRRRAVLLHQ